MIYLEDWLTLKSRRPLPRGGMISFAKRVVRAYRELHGGKAPSRRAKYCYSEYADDRMIEGVYQRFLVESRR